MNHQFRVRVVLLGIIDGTYDLPHTAVHINVVGAATNVVEVVLNESKIEAQMMVRQNGASIVDGNGMSIHSPSKRNVREQELPRQDLTQVESCFFVKLSLIDGGWETEHDPNTDLWLGIEISLIDAWTGEVVWNEVARIMTLKHNQETSREKVKRGKADSSHCYRLQPSSVDTKPLKAKHLLLKDNMQCFQGKALASLWYLLQCKVLVQVERLLGAILTYFLSQ